MSTFTPLGHFTYSEGVGASTALSPMGRSGAVLTGWLVGLTPSSPCRLWVGHQPFTLADWVQAPAGVQNLARRRKENTTPFPFKNARGVTLSNNGGRGNNKQGGVTLWP